MRYNKPYTKWSEQDILDRLDEIAQKDGEFPTRTRLNELKEFRLTNAITHHGLTFHDLAIRLGYEYDRKPRGYWTEDRVLEELKNLERELGEFPTINYIQRNRVELMGAIFRTRDWRYYKSKLGQEYQEKWNKDKIISRFQQAVEKLNRVPTSGDLLKHDPKLLSAIDRSSDSLRELTLELGYRPSQRQKGFWKVWENVEKEILPRCEAGKMPPVAQLKQILGSSVALAIADFGGVVEVAERLGVEVSPDSYLTSKDGHALKSTYEVEFDDFLYECGVPHEVDCEIIPNRKIRCDFKIGNSFVEIWGFEERTNNTRCERYSKKRAMKEKLYKDNSLKLISIEATTFRKTKDARRRIFQEKLDEVSNI